MKWKVGDEFYIIDNEKDSLGITKESIKKPFKIVLTTYEEDLCNIPPGKSETFKNYVWFQFEEDDTYYYISKSNIKPVSKLHKVLA